MKQTLLFFFLMISTLAAHAETVDDKVITDKSRIIGAERSRVFINSSNLESLPDLIRSQAYATANFGWGSAFYIGGKGGAHYMLTAAHTALGSIPKISPEDRILVTKDPINLCRTFLNNENSQMKEFYFGLLNIYVSCEKLVYLDEKSDVAIFKVDTYGQQMPDPIEIQKTNAPLRYGTQLGFYSYSRFQNFGLDGDGELDLVFSTDIDCRNFSEDKQDMISDLSLIRGEEIRRSVYAVGCDFVEGDSGGPVFDLTTGKLVGMVFGGREQSIRKIGEEGLGLYKNFVELPEVFRKKIRNQYLNYISIIDTNIFDFNF